MLNICVSLASECEPWLTIPSSLKLRKDKEIGVQTSSFQHWKITVLVTFGNTHRIIWDRDPNPGFFLVGEMGGAAAKPSHRILATKQRKLHGEHHDYAARSQA